MLLSLFCFFQFKIGRTKKEKKLFIRGSQNKYATTTMTRTAAAAVVAVATKTKMKEKKKKAKTIKTAFDDRICCSFCLSLLCNSFG